jgi:16S rRNA (uracil1498-N3)-methyltransferase
MKQFVLSFNPDASENNSEFRFTVTGKDFHYLIHVRRYSTEDSFPALSPDGRTFIMKILQVKKDSCTAGLLPVQRDKSGTDNMKSRITLMPALIRGRKMDIVIRQAVEAGAFAIWPVLTENCQVKYGKNSGMSEKKKRWERIAVEALQQCGGDRPVTMNNPDRLIPVLEKWGKRGPLLFLHEKYYSGKDSSSLHESLAETPDELAILTGPEGGFSPDETKLLREEGALPVYLGNRILRAETAVIYGLAAVSTIIRERAEWQMA